MQGIRFLLALWLGRLAAFAIRLVARGRGTNLPGQIALWIDPFFLRHVRGLDQARIIYVTGTNGKSTTTNLLAHVFRSAGISCAANLAGANLLPGAVVVLMRSCTLAGRFRPQYLLLETDERFLPIIWQQLPAGQLVVTNIQKDQVQRNGEPDVIYRKIRSVLSPEVTLFLNNDEPNTASLARFAGRSIRYGVAENSASFQKEDFYSVTMPCPVCGAPVRFAAYNIDNIGPFSCESCGFASTAQPEYLAEQVDFAAQEFTCGSTRYPFRYSTPYFLYCYIAALAVAQELGISTEAVRKAFTDFVNVGGRMEEFRLMGKNVHYLRMKQENPETLQSALNVIAADKRPKVFLLGLEELVDFEPHYTNTFYSFDCDFEALLASNVERCICFSDAVACDTALRLLYAGADPDKVTVIATNDEQTLAKAIAGCESEDVYLITWLHAYYALSAYAKKHQEAEA